jgi:hypothetical protein
MRKSSAARCSHADRETSPRACSTRSNSDGGNEAVIVLRGGTLLPFVMKAMAGPAEPLDLERLRVVGVMALDGTFAATALAGVGTHEDRLTAHGVRELHPGGVLVLADLHLPLMTAGLTGSLTAQLRG